MVLKLSRLRVSYGISSKLREVLITPQAMAAIPLVLAGAYLVGGELALLAAAGAVPLTVLFGDLLSPPKVECGPRDPLTGLPLKDTAARFIAELLKRHSRRRQTVVMAIGIDDGPRTAPRVGPHVWDLALAQVGDRITDVLRGGDQIVRLDGPAFGIVLRRLRRPGEKDALAIAERLQKTIAAPIHLQGARLQVTASVGICLEADRPGDDASEFMAAAEAALEEAQVHGENSVRIFTGEIRTRLVAKSDLSDTVEDALASGQITCWFQPQICARTGAVTGLEALARWEHPVRGTLLPDDFLDPISARGLGPQLFRVVLARACAALRDWDRSGLHVPRVSVNVDGATLRGPMIAEQIAWELDRFDLTPERLVIEVLEDVILSPGDDVLAHNLGRIAELGTTIDLDGFGVSRSSMAGIPHFGINRLKIDRSFVTGAAQHAEQQRMAAAILDMARRLGLATLAEGVASGDEHRLFASLCCDQLQGFGIGRPMPAAAIPGWILQHHAGETRLRSDGAAGPGATMRAGETA